MIKDYPDTMPSYTSSSSLSVSPTPSSSSLFSTLSPPSTPTTASPPLTPTRAVVGLPAPLPPVQIPPPARPSAPLAPPPMHPSQLPMQTTYTPYVPRARRAVAGIGATATAKAVQHAAIAPNPLSATGQQVPIITSSAQGGITTRHPVQPIPLSPNPSVSTFGSASGVPHNSQRDHTHGPSAALLDKVRALDSLPRLGELRTLDLRGNDIRVRTHCLRNFTFGLTPPLHLVDRDTIHRSGAKTQPYPQSLESQ